ncbi:hypothetical protein [Actinomadura harenae]|uniref:Uncharacterized protein n=1 Tax=Actinomadura harenae TaxID=2483351 RepID=A0A3M2MDY9_9ACTN|nr:hypothetical protein [Actinomadura harenae]RMI47772.1 hypothetical protein EBO15_00220 [Actinomadura harenae]
MRTPRLAGLLLAPVLALGLSACGNGGGGDKLATQSAKKADEATKLRNFAKCMREHGVDMKDPGDDGRITMMQSKGAPGGGEQAMQAAQKACQHLMPNGGKPKQASPQDIDRLRKYAQCMRGHGISMEDPGSDGGIRIRMTGPPQGSQNGGDPANDPTLKAAQEACKQFQPGRVK